MSEAVSQEEGGLERLGSCGSAEAGQKGLAMLEKLSLVALWLLGCLGILAQEAGGPRRQLGSEKAPAQAGPPHSSAAAHPVLFGYKSVGDGRPTRIPHPGGRLGPWPPAPGKRLGQDPGIICLGAQKNHGEALTSQRVWPNLCRNWGETLGTR